MTDHKVLAETMRDCSLDVLPERLLHQAVQAGNTDDITLAVIKPTKPR